MPIQQVAHLTNGECESIKTALIPFCEFGGDMSVMGVTMDDFDVPVCNSFRPKIVKDQLCYTVDPNEYKHKIDKKGELSLSLFIHYNEDRQMEDGDQKKPKITIDTIGTSSLYEKFFNLDFSEPLELPLGYSYDFTFVKELIATDSFLTLDEDIRKCQVEPKNDCSTRKYLEDLKNKCQCLPFQLRSLIDQDVGSIDKVLV